MHACHALTVDQLLSLRDAEPVEAYIVQHVNTCAACARELARLHEIQDRLRQLPVGITAPHYDAAAIARRARANDTWRTARAAGVGALAAGVCALAVAIGLSFDSADDGATHANSAVALDTPSVNTAQRPHSTRATPRLVDLVLQSQDLESRLSSLPSRPLVERASTTVAIDSLQSRIQWVDYQLSMVTETGMSEPQATSLWQDRVQLMDSLVKVRYAEAQRFAALQ